jgi:uncharacterized protein YjbJ (UPF0337 family)
VNSGRADEEITVNEDILQGKWAQLKGKLREQWGKLTDDDIDRIAGRSEQLIGRVQERYGLARDEAQRQVDDFLRADQRSSVAGRY